MCKDMLPSVLLAQYLRGIGMFVIPIHSFYIFIQRANKSAGKGVSQSNWFFQHSRKKSFKGRGQGPKSPKGSKIDARICNINRFVIMVNIIISCFKFEK